MACESIGAFIAELRKENHLTQKMLATKLGVSDKTVSRWERSETAPDLSLLPAIAEIFHITTDELLSGRRKEAEAEDSFETAEGEVKEEAGKRLTYLITSVKNQYQIRSVISGTIGAGGIGIVIAILEGISYGHGIDIDSMSSILGIFILFLAIIYQTVATMQSFHSIGNWECEFDDIRIQGLKKEIIRLDKKMFRIFMIDFILVMECVINGPYWDEIVLLSFLWITLGMIICSIAFKLMDKWLYKRGII